MEPGLGTQVLGLLLEKMSRDVPFKESRAFLLSSSPDRVATLLPLAVSAPALPSPHGWVDPQRVWHRPQRHLAAAWGPRAARAEPSLVKAHRCRSPRETTVSAIGKSKPGLGSYFSGKAAVSSSSSLLRSQEQMVGGRAWVGTRLLSLLLPQGPSRAASGVLTHPRPLGG